MRMSTMMLIISTYRTANKDPFQRCKDDSNRMIATIEVTLRETLEGTLQVLGGAI